MESMSGVLDCQQASDISLIYSVNWVDPGGVFGLLVGICLPIGIICCVFCLAQSPRGDSFHRTHVQAQPGEQPLLIAFPAQGHQYNILPAQESL